MAQYLRAFAVTVSGLEFTSPGGPHKNQSYPCTAITPAQEGWRRNQPV